MFNTRVTHVKLIKGTLSLLFSPINWGLSFISLTLKFFIFCLLTLKVLSSIFLILKLIKINETKNVAAEFMLKLSECLAF